MRRTRSTIGAIVCAVLLVAGEVAAFIFAWKEGVWVSVAQIVGFAIGCVFAPIIHELGHILFAKSQNMQIVYAKFSFLKIQIKRGKKRLSFASPFAPDETQVLPKTGGNMEKRTRFYTLGGLIFSGIYVALVCGVALALTLTVGGIFAYAVWGLAPYATYLFLLNVLPLEYNSGKTDALVYSGIKKGEPAEKTMLFAMEIQGELCEGKRYGEIDEKWYFDLPQLPEDEPLFAVILDLRYRYYLDKGEMQKAAECLNRLAQASEYLTDTETEKIAAEFVYMHALNGDTERAEACVKGCQAYLQAETATAKRVLSAVAMLGGKRDALDTLIAQAQALLHEEKILGNRKLEETLLSRLV